ncbi:Uma2 family endonuclease [Acinetobacter puyangensis]|uniref:Endonuclease, Uma2 family (Restriction endonuclease fold) n=1 Tax=Acinetobacter puyangensis TaxID=1096779 RepID=A0A240E8H9_9GAMM|nr:Uma2 family endonuclease [Acinetobacter puyangensis]SNX44553.1 Endonuclease, Uma2 family (restriction endonuclease fold) [Acinetobacter puyangensis]
MANLTSSLKISEQDYLAGELVSEIKHEYIDGKVFAMTDFNVNHCLLTGNILFVLGNHLKGQPCRPYVSNMKVKIETKYFYPDVLVDCSDFNGKDNFTQTPILIVEVLSDSTQKYDKTLKLETYLTIASLQEYILIEQDKAEVQVLRRSEGWKPNYYFLGDEAIFESVGLKVAVEDIYDRIQNEDVREWLELKAQVDGDKEAF